MLTKEDILDALQSVVDPEIGLGIVELGLVYDVAVEDEGKKLQVKMTLTTPMCPYGPMLVGQVEEVLKATPGVEAVDVALVWDPPWDPRTMASDEAKDKLMIW